jgi:hypothetical protein
VAHWLKPVILGALACLAPGPDSTSCWSVKNFKTNKAYPLADVTKQIHKEAGWTLVKTITMTGSARPGGNRFVDKIEEYTDDAGIQQTRTIKQESRQSEEETFCFRRV